MEKTVDIEVQRRPVKFSGLSLLALTFQTLGELPVTQPPFLESSMNLLSRQVSYTATSALPHCMS